MIKCPWCGKNLSDYKYPAKHIRTTCKYIPQNLAKVEIIDKTFNTISGYSAIELINDYNNLFSLPDLSKKYKISYNFIQDILKLHNIKLRNISESAKKITSKKIKETCLKNYGVNNPSQLNYVKEKRSEFNKLLACLRKISTLLQRCLDKQMFPQQTIRTNVHLISCIFCNSSQIPGK